MLVIQSSDSIPNIYLSLVLLQGTKQETQCNTAALTIAIVSDDFSNWFTFNVKQDSILAFWNHSVIFPKLKKGTKGFSVVIMTL